MLDKKKFNRIINEMGEYDELREQLIKKSRDVLKASKQLIYSIHRNDAKSIELLLNSAKNEKKKLDAIKKKKKKLLCESTYSEALQEYTEALCYYWFIKKKKIPSPDELEVNNEDYLMGVCDLTGELTRRAVYLTVKKKFDSVFQIRDFVEGIYGEFLKLNLRNSQLRKKSDSIKWNLKKLEEIMYDIKTRR